MCTIHAVGENEGAKVLFACSQGNTPTVAAVREGCRIELPQFLRPELVYLFEVERRRPRAQAGRHGAGRRCGWMAGARLIRLGRGGRSHDELLLLLVLQPD